MQARIVPTPRGAQWLADGWHMFRAAPLGWISVAFLYGLIMMVLSAIPVIGTAAFLLAYPALTVGLMAAARAASRRAPVEAGMLFDGFRHGLRAQLILGAVYLACSIVVFAGTLLADGGEALRTVMSGRRTQDVEMDDVLLPLGIMAVLYTPMLMMFWFAPPLAAWHAVAAPKALFFSFVACLINWRAMLVYGMVTMGAILLLAFGLLLGVALTGGATRAVPMFAILVVALLALPTLFASFYASYRDVFGIESPEIKAEPTAE
jgi:hypothetical protein